MKWLFVCEITSPDPDPSHAEQDSNLTDILGKLVGGINDLTDFSVDSTTLVKGTEITI